MLDKYDADQMQRSTTARCVINETRWDRLPTATRQRFGQRFAELTARGEDIDGEARLADALAPRAATILDAGSGLGRVGAALAARGHAVTGVEKDPVLAAESRCTHPDLAVVEADLTDVTPELLRKAGRPAEYDLIVIVGNVLILLADGTEQATLTRLRVLLAPGGRILAGFHLAAGAPGSRVYPFTEFEADAAAAGLRVELRAGTFDLRPATDEFAVTVLSPAIDPTPSPTGGPPITLAP